MNPLESEVCRVLDLPETYLLTAKSEAVDKAKLRNTWLFVNDTLSFVHSLDFSTNIIVCETIPADVKGIIVESLDTFVPEAGLYFTELGVLSVTKKAAKSWVKSFRLENYIIHYVDYKEKKVSHSEIKALATSQPELITTDISGKVWMYGVKNEVAVFTDNEEVNVKDSKYYQEVLDYINRKGLECPVNLL